MERLKQTSFIYFGIAYIALFSCLFLFVNFNEITGITELIFLLTRNLCYAALYLVLPVLISLAVFYSFKNKETHKFSKVFLAALLISFSLPFIAVHSDFLIYDLYGYHFNAFIWNIIVTKGGIEALGTTGSTRISIAAQILLILVSAAVILKLSYKFAKEKDFSLSKKKLYLLIFSFLIITGIEEVSFAYAKQTGNTEILRAASYIPFSIPTSMSKIFKFIGVPKAGNTQFMPNEKINYPLKKIILEKKPSYPNIIILTAESFRWDLLDQKITPNLCQLAKKSLNFTNHYSGGNRTRMGMFSLFYGLYAPYWFAFEKEKISPVLMNAVQQLNYQIELNTSQSFDYPELRKTLFAGIEEKYMHELQQGPSWKRDEDNIEMIINSIQNRQAGRPFFNFMFFESTHAPYNFPEEAVIEPDYEKDVNYLKISGLGDNIYKIHNRYINAAHHIDAQVGKLITFLEKEHLMENSIILFTGDHGEEFMEKGRWGHGHNSRFTKYQTKVPFILSVPGETAREINTETNHLQFPAFLLDKLGVSNNYQDYSLTPSLLQKKPDYFLIGNYNYITLQDELYKITFPFTGQDYFHYNIYHKDNDNFVLKNEENSIIKTYDTKLKKVYAELQRFYQNSQFNTDQDFVIDKPND